jgi:hypothetical protein
VLAPGGQCFATWFLLNEDSRALIAQGKSTLPFRHPIEGGMTTNADTPGEAIAVDERRVRDAHREGGLVIEDPVRYGSWCGRATFVSFQDIVVARNARP